MKEVFNILLKCRKIGGRKPLFSATILIMLIINSFNVQAQEMQTITGEVTDTSGEALIGVNVVVKNTTIGVITDFDGHFVLKVPQDGTLVFSYLGFVAQTISPEGKTVINVTLEEDFTKLDEVVVVGFGTQKKVNVTGSVATASAEDLKERPVANAVQALQGLIPGLNISNSGNGGELNAKKSINIRGIATIGDDSNGDPLILIDGMEGDINTINPQDIESISVLKDAAASSIYGSRAPFGVVLVTTKRGKEGKTVINYNNSFRFSTPVLLPDMQNSWEFVNFYDDANFNVSNSHLYSDDYKNLVHSYYKGELDPTDVAYPGSGGKWNYDYTYGNVDWLKEYYKHWSPSQEHNMSISGGSKGVTYYVSSNYMTQDGFMRYGTESYDRFNLTGKISAELSKYVKIDYSNRFVRAEYGRPTNMNDGFYDNILRRARPVRPVADPNGYYMSDINYIQTMSEGGRQKEQNDKLTQQFRATFTPAKDWNIIGEMNISTDNNWTHWDQKRVYAHKQDDPEQTYKAITSPGNEQVYEYAYKSTFLNPNIYTNYTKEFGKHTFAGKLGFQSEQMKYRKMSAQRTDLVNLDMPVLDLTTNKENYSMMGQYQEWATAGFFSRVNYDFEGKYLAEFNLRYDGTSRFRVDKRWIWTPSFSLGWNIAREDFWSPLVDYIGTFKLRGSYGVLSNQNTTNWYPTYQTLSTGASDGMWLINGAKPNTASVPGLISTSLTWEKIKTTNFGVDFGMLSNRLNGSFDYFERKTENMVGPGVELPAILGIGVPKTNNTDLKTYGWELALQWRDKKGDFSYGIRLNISDSQTKILKYPNRTGDLGQYRGGELTGDIYGYTTIGIAKTDDEMNAHLVTLTDGGQTALGSSWAAGDIMYADINGDGRIDNGSNTMNDMGDLKKIGNSTPRYRTGINLDASWKGFDVQMFWQGVLKRDFDPGENSMVFWGATGSGQWWSTAMTEHLDYFRDDANHPLGLNTDSYYPRPLFNNKNHKTQTRYLQDASYMRLKNLQIGYTFPKALVSRVGLQNLRLYVSGENLLTITNLSKTMDPETAGIGRQGGTVYPLSKTYSFGLSVNF
ncbi:TonB-dependent receptor [Labilibaculum manganireducens]|uniref:SusC/RagA family TonB-linked outer membrane protein n=1 Tax=Labilibaculum manganireducens TaxID=1940525 RepID=UPI0029F4B149|nr:TonB-dependent receptor [Labilibaculum manganireducens]